MCIIFYNETGKLYDKDEISVSYDNNPHGVGLMWIEDGKVQTLRGLFKKEQLFDILGHFEGVPHALHLRWRTKGAITKDQCHPFRASHKGSDQSVHLMHNGTIFNLNPPEGYSDTHMFASKLQDVTREYGTDMLFEESFLRKCERNIKSFNKVILLRDDGQVAIMNPDEWTVKNEIWYSNTCSLKADYRKAKVFASKVKTRKANTELQARIRDKANKALEKAQIKSRRDYGTPVRPKKKATEEEQGTRKDTRRVLRRRYRADGTCVETVLR